MSPAFPCPPRGQIVAVVAGEKSQVVLQKNLDHYYATTPGNFSVYLWDAAGKSQLLASIPDDPSPSMTLYPVTVTLPSTVPAGNYTLQSVYYTNNPGAPADFFQCADVVVFGSANAAEVAAAASHVSKH
jgi:hypothetical protein